MSKKLSKTLETTRLAGARIVAVAAKPGGPEVGSRTDFEKKVLLPKEGSQPFLLMKPLRAKHPVRLSPCFSHLFSLFAQYYCKSRIFHMHFIFVYFVRGGFRPKTKCMLKVHSKSEYPHRSAAVQNFHAYQRSEVPSTRKFSANEIFWIYSIQSQVVKPKNAQQTALVICIW